MAIKKLSTFLLPSCKQCLHRPVFFLVVLLLHQINMFLFYMFPPFQHSTFKNFDLSVSLI